MVILACSVLSLSIKSGFWVSSLSHLSWYAFVVHHFNFVLDDCIFVCQVEFYSFLPKAIQKRSEQRISNELHSNLNCAHGDA